jgi:predicted ATPase/class 3 adenylate cyclase/DNA-binding CsgD family transcriptional regulator
MTHTEPTATLPTGVVTFLLTDVEGSTQLWERTPELMTGVIARHYEVLHTAVRDHRGALPVEQGEGDSIVAVFRTPADAVAAALAAQRALAAEPWPEGVEVPVRMALHTGDAKLRDAGNYAGETIIRTARLRALAHGRQVIASRQCADLAADALPDGAAWLDLGSYRLKNLSRAEQVLQLTHADLVEEFPPLRGPDSVTNNLPTQLTPFIGREAELAQLHALLDDARLLTVTGSGGCGKTRLALEAATDRVDRHPDGIWYVELAPLGETSSVVAALASVLHVQEIGEESLLDALVARLADARALVLIDNCEHLLDESAQLVEALLRGCPPLQVMTTSRQPLNLPGEVTWRVPSLRAPKADETPTVESLAQYDAVQLFVDRAVRARPNFTVTNDNVAAVALICDRLDGIPLAIELAAARVRSLSVTRIAEGLDDRFRLLRGGSTTLLPRQQTLYESIEWSHHMLTPAEQALLRRLALFCGGFTLDAAEAVADFEPLDPYDILDLLGGLVDRSLVVLDDEGPTDRYRLLETIKQFARRRLEDATEMTAVLDRHLAYFADLAAVIAPDLETGAQRASRPVLEREAENLRVALVHADGDDDPTVLGRLAWSLVLYWFQTARFGEGDHWLATTVESLAGATGDAAALRARLLWGRGYLNFYSGMDFALTTELAQAALAEGEACGDPLATARGTDLCADLAQFSAPLESIAALQHALELSRTEGDAWGETDILQKIGYSYIYADRYAQARPWLDAAATLGLQGDNPFFVAWHHNGIAYGNEYRGAPDARADAAIALDAAQSAGDLTTWAWSVGARVVDLVRWGDADAAAELAADHRERIVARGAAPVALFLVDLAEAKAAVFAGDTGWLDALQEYVDTWREQEVVVAEGWCLVPLAFGRVVGGGDPTEAITRLAELALQLESPLLGGVAALLDGVVALGGGDPERAADLARSALQQWREERFDTLVLAALDVLAWASGAGGDATTAGRLHAVTERERVDRGWAWAAHETAWHDAAREAATDAESFASGAAAATELSFDDAVTMVLRARGARLRPATGWPSLTPTEREVVALVAEGLSNPEVAERLFMSRSTVKTHLNHVFAKLGIATRAELAAAFVRDAHS